MTNEELEARFLAIEGAATKERNTLRELKSQFSELKESVDRALQMLLPKVFALLTNREEPSGASTGNPTVTSNSTILEAAEKGDVETLHRMLDAGADFRLRNKQGDNALHLAARKGHERAVLFLVSYRALVNARGHRNRTPLHYATEEGHIGVIRRLLNAGTDLNAEDDDGKCALMLAMQSGLPEAVSLILRRGRPYRGSEIYLALSKNVSVVWAFQDGIPGFDESIAGRAFALASEKGCLESIEALLDAGVRIDTCINYNTSLHNASKNGHSDCVEMLIKRGASLNTVNNYGYTPLHYATMQNKEQCVRLLLQAGANVTIIDSNKKTPLDYATTDVIRQIFSDCAQRS